MKKIRNFKLTMLCRMLILALMIAPAAAFIMPMTVHAEDPAPEPEPATLDVWEIEDYIGKKNAGLNAALAEEIALALQNLAGNNLGELLKWDTADIEIALELWETMKLLGACMGIMYFLLEMNHAVFLASSNWTMQTLMTPLLKFGIVIGVIQYGGKLVGTILSFGNYLIGVLTEETVDGAKLTVEFCDQIKQLGFLEVIFMMIPVFVMILVSFLVSLVFVYKAFSYKLEVMIRVAITPVVFGDIWDGRNSHCIRWLKKLAGLMLYGACFVLIIRCGIMLNLSDMMKTVKDQDTTTALLSSPGGVAGAAAGAKAVGASCWMLLKGTLYAFLIPIAEIGALSLAKNACMEVFG